MTEQAGPGGMRGWVRTGLAVVLCASIAGAARAADGIETAGDILRLVLPAAAAGVTFVHHDNAGTWQLAESIGVAMGTTVLLKYTIDEQRPDGRPHSFPSGHTSLSFASAEFLRRRYGWEYGVPAYALAAFVGYSRVHAREHYVHDVLAGAALGIASSYIFAKPSKSWQVRAELGRDARSITLWHSW